MENDFIDTGVSNIGGFGIQKKNVCKDLDQDCYKNGEIQEEVLGYSDPVRVMGICVSCFLYDPSKGYCPFTNSLN